MTDFSKRYGPAVLVTGASDGIGKAIAYDVAARGLDVVLVARRPDVLDNIASDLQTQHEVTATPLALDLSDPQALPSELDARGLQIGLTVAAAGFGLSGPLAKAKLADEINMIDVNCKSVLALTHWSVRHMTPRQKGGIMLFSSIVAFQGVPNSANYAATKAWNQVLAEGLAAENPWLDVLSVAPGPVNTGFGARSGIDTSTGATPEIVAQAALTALPRGGTVRPTLMNKFLQANLGMLPRGLRTKVMAKAMSGMMQGA